MSIKRLVSFHGQGSVIDFSKVVFRQSHINQLYETQHKKFCIDSPGLPQTVATLSHLLYQDQHAPSTDTKVETLYVGHSLGELQAFLNGNNLLNLKDTIDVANYRHMLMKQQVEQYTAQQASSGEHTSQMQMAALLITKKFSLENPDYLVSLKKHLQSAYRSLDIANINTDSSVVLSGFQHELEHLLLQQDKTFNVPRKFKILENPDKIAFHNNKILNRLKEPLYDYIWAKLKDNKTHTVDVLNHRVVCNYDGQLVESKDDLLEKFVLQSCNTVQFVKCCETIKCLDIEQFTHIGPVPTVMENIIQRNLSS